jgi:hypothetical protein
MIWFSGQFHGVISAQTPTGSRRTSVVPDRGLRERFECRAGRRYRAIHIDLAAETDPGDYLLGGRVLDCVGVGSGRRCPLAVDVEKCRVSHAAKDT